MNQGIHQHDPLPGGILGSQSPAVRTPQIVTAPPAAQDQARQDATQQKFDQRLTAILQGMVEGFACDAADFYQLNDASNELILRSHYEVADGEPGADRRPLNSARADVVAMSGSAVVLEDDTEVAGWPVPVWCGAAFCLPVASDQTIHGTLWLYSSQPRSFADAELQLAEVVAGRLAVELELQTWRTAGEGRNDPAPTRAVEVGAKQEPTAGPSTATTHVLRPASAPQLEEWELAGWTQADVAFGAFFDWQTLADGRTLVATGAVANRERTDGWLQAARIALRAHAEQASDAGELLSLANQTLWLASPGGEELAVATALLDAVGERASVATAGAAGIARWRAASCEWTHTTHPPLGWSECAAYASHSIDLIVRERLVLATADAMVLSQQPKPNKQSQAKLAGRLRRGSPHELRTMSGKRALEHFVKAAQAVGIEAAGLALVRRR